MASVTVCAGAVERAGSFPAAPFHVEGLQKLPISPQRDDLDHLLNVIQLRPEDSPQIGCA